MVKQGKIFGIAATLILVLSLAIACAPAAAPTAAPVATPTLHPPTPVPGAPTPTAAPPKPTPTRAPATPAPAAEKPRYGGVFTKGHGASWSKFDLHQTSSSWDGSLWSGLFNHIVAFDVYKNELAPDLAKSWETSQDGRTFTFRFREGIKWHDGKPFTSADAKYSLDRIAKPPPGMVVPRAGVIPILLEKTETPDANTLVVTLKNPAASFLEALTSQWLPVLPKHILEEKGEIKTAKDMVGTGPFKIKSAERDVAVAQVKNPDYFRKDLPYLDEIVHVVIPDLATRTAAFKAHKILIGCQTRQPSWPEILKIKEELGDKVVAEKIPSNAHDQLHINTKVTTWSDARVRRAAHLAIDRQKVNKLYWSGYGFLGGFFNPIGGWDMPQEKLLSLPGWRQPKDQDIAEAKKLMAEAGYPNGFETVISARTGYERLALVFQEDLAKIGIKATVKPLEPVAGYAAYGKGDFEVAANATQYDTLDPDAVFSFHYLKTAGRNWGKWENAKFEALYKQESAMLDPAKRRQSIEEMVQILLDEVPNAVTTWRPLSDIWWAELKNWKENPVIFFPNRYEEVWLAK